MFGFTSEFGVSQVAEGSEAIVDGYDDDAFFGEGGAVVDFVGPGAACEAASVNPYHDGSALIRVFGGGPDV